MTETANNESTNLEPEEEFLEIKQMLDLEVTGWLDGKTLSCAVDVKLLSKNGKLRWTSRREAFSTNVTFFVKGMFSYQSPFYIHQINIT